MDEKGIDVILHSFDSGKSIWIIFKNMESKLLIVDCHTHSLKSMERSSGYLGEGYDDVIHCVI